MKSKIFIISIISLVTFCRTFSEYHVNGFYIDNSYSLQTTVDSSIARDYFEKSVNQANIPGAALNFFNSWDKKELNHDNLKELSTETSTDFATLYFVRRVMQVPENRNNQKRFDEIVKNLKESDYFQKNANKNTLFVFIPGLGYKTNRELGADFALQRRTFQEMGIPNTIIEMEEYGRIMQNANIVAENINVLSRTYKSIILVSASKSSAEVAIALGKILKPEETTSVKGWISLCGVLRGTPYAKSFHEGILGIIADLFLSFNGVSNKVKDDLLPEFMEKIYKTLQFPDHIKMIQYVAVPLSGQIESRAIDGYRELRREGPNDGRTLLADQLIDGGQVILSLGSDHYFKEKDIKERSVALAILTQELAQKQEIDTALMKR